jgi:hypothetical protein
MKKWTKKSDYETKPINLKTTWYLTSWIWTKWEDSWVKFIETIYNWSELIIYQLWSYLNITWKWIRDIVNYLREEYKCEYIILDSNIWDSIYSQLECQFMKAPIDLLDKIRVKYE